LEKIHEDTGLLFITLVDNTSKLNVSSKIKIIPYHKCSNPDLWDKISPIEDDEARTSYHCSQGNLSS